MWSRPHVECHWPGISNLMSVKAADIGINIKQLGARNGIRVRSRESGVGPWLPGCPVTRAMCTRVASADRKLRARRSADFPRIPHREPPLGRRPCAATLVYLHGRHANSCESVGRSLDFFVWFVGQRMLATCPGSSSFSRFRNSWIGSVSLLVVCHLPFNSHSPEYPRNWIHFAASWWNFKHSPTKLRLKWKHYKKIPHYEKGNLFILGFRWDVTGNYQSIERDRRGRTCKTFNTWIATFMRWLTLNADMVSKRFLRFYKITDFQLNSNNSYSL